MKQLISFVTIAVNDFQKEFSFYKDVLKWQPFNVIEGVIAFFKLSNDTGTELETKPYLGFTLAQNVPSEQIVDEIFNDIRKAGDIITKEPVRASWGGYSGYFTDPEGHLWEVAHNPQFEYSLDGIMIIP